MKNLRNARSFCILMIVFGAWGLTRGETPPPMEWPRVLIRDGLTNTIYQPQLESWDYTTLKAISAVSIQRAGQQQATFGTINFVAKTRVDRADRKVFVEELEISDGDFPSASS